MGYFVHTREDARHFKPTLAVSGMGRCCADNEVYEVGSISTIAEKAPELKARAVGMTGPRSQIMSRPGLAGDMSGKGFPGAAPLPDGSQGKLSVHS